MRTREYSSLFNRSLGVTRVLSLSLSLSVGILILIFVVTFNQWKYENKKFENKSHGLNTSSLNHPFLDTLMKL